MLLKKIKKHATISERSFFIGVIAESIQPLCSGGVLCPPLPHLLQMFDCMCQDTEDNCRNDAVFGLGEMLLWGGTENSQHRENILRKFSEMLLSS